MYKNNIVIVGAGMAGTNAAITLRKEGFKGKIILIDKDKSIPYDRPPLSKKYLSDELSDEEILLKNYKYYKDNDIDLYLGQTVTSINYKNQVIILESGEKIQWGKVLIAIGSKLIRLNIPGHHLEGIHYLRTKADAEYLKDKLSQVKKITIIGAGFIGLEIASVCKSLNINVTIIEALSTPLEKVLGKEMGEYIRKLHSSKGIEFVLGEFVEEFVGSQYIKKIITNTGREILCDAVVVGIGVKPDLRIIETSEIKKEKNGLKVDSYGRTNIPNVYAAGDCASWEYNNEIVRVEHWDHAINHGINTAKNMIYPKSIKYSQVPYFWSDQHQIRFQYLGVAKDWDYTIKRGDVSSNQFSCFYIKNNEVVGVLFVNDTNSIIPVRRFMTRKGKLKNINDLKDTSKKIKKILSNN